MAAPPMTVVISFDDTVDLTDESLPEPLITPRSQAIECTDPRSVTTSRNKRKSLSDWWSEEDAESPERPTPPGTEVYSWASEHTDLEIQQMHHIADLQSQLQLLQQRLEMEQQMRAEAEEVSPASPEVKPSTLEEPAVAPEEEPEMAAEESLSSSEPEHEMSEQEPAVAPEEEPEMAAEESLSSSEPEHEMSEQASAFQDYDALRPSFVERVQNVCIEIVGIFLGDDWADEVEASLDNP
eukprot:TRINITY_DN5532_c0_g1_i2.p1 TRINITY_DN5532_c0_g1~~TRINITY_DN5532_c0_g1_i2.p1  ORF type:complete len:239 (-),score=58.48 TRINITY_DN5532_c0_g1_i2:104-820(-)